MDRPVFTLIEGGDVHAPEPLGKVDVLVAGARVVRLGPGDGGLRGTALPVEVVDARGCLVTPGLVDAHAHLIGTGGEQGFASRTAEVAQGELVRAGVTTVVGCLGTDDVSRSLPALVARARQLQRQGIDARAYTGSFHVPVPTLTGSIRSDLVLVPELVGIGEVAIADFRAVEPTVEELARIASEGLVGGLLGEKAGVLHVHVGPGRTRLSLLHAVLDRFELPGRQLYPTHVQRTEALLDDALALAARGSWVDFDCIEPVGAWVRRWLARGGDPARLTLSSDAHSPDADEGKLRDALVALIQEDRLPIERALALVTRNPAAALKLPAKGRLREGGDADVVVWAQGPLAVRDVFARGLPLLRDGRLLPPPASSFEVA